MLTATSASAAMPLPGLGRIKTASSKTELEGFRA
jgi:hypothetical protein